MSPWPLALAACTGKAPVTDTSPAPNHLPSAPAVVVYPPAPSTQDDLEAILEAEASDPDGDPIAYRYRWSVDEVERFDLSAPVVPAAETASGQLWRVTVSADDGRGLGPEVRAEVRVGNSAPTIGAVDLSPAAPTEADTLVATADTQDIDDDTLTLTWTWFVDGALVWTSTRNTLTGADFDKHQEVWVELTASDGLATAGPVVSAPVTILNTPPAVDAAQLSASALFEGTTLRCEGVGWQDVDGDPEGYDVRWTVNGAAVSAEPELTGARFDRGDAVSCTLTPDDGEDMGDPAESDAAIVLNSPPRLGGVSIQPAAPTARDTLSVLVAAASDDDGDPVTWAAEWFVNAGSVGVSETLDPAMFTAGDRVHAQVTASDGLTTGLPVTATPVTIAP
ncbi:MAG: hypothetical protein H6739_40555 [Alphaproteobacteria bacterium]|nr:hypothetical protein [Alphaproteobacteria bacterium]